jgi:hypothetical protein
VWELPCCVQFHWNVNGLFGFWDSSAVFKYFDYVNTTTKQRHRVSYDDPETLLLKYKALLSIGMYIL